MKMRPLKPTHQEMVNLYCELLEHLVFWVDYKKINSMSLQQIVLAYDELFDNYIGSW